MNRPIRIKIHVFRHRCTKVRGEHPHSLQHSILQLLSAQANCPLSESSPVSRPWSCLSSISRPPLLLSLSCALLFRRHRAVLHSAELLRPGHATAPTYFVAKLTSKYPLKYVQNVLPPSCKELFVSQCFEPVDPGFHHQHASLPGSGVSRHHA